MRTYVHLKQVLKIKVNKYHCRRILFNILCTFNVPMYNYISTDIQIDCSVDSETESAICCTTFTVVTLMKLLYFLKNKQSFLYQYNASKDS